MDKLLINQLQFYVPPEVMKTVMSDQKRRYQIAKYIVDKEFKHKPQKWKTVAFPEYEDFFQAAVVGFNPYKATSGARDKGILQAIDSYNPYKKEETSVALEEIDGVLQAVCPHCKSRGEVVSLWPATAGNVLDSVHAPEPMFYLGNKYCGKQIIADDLKIEEWLRQELIRSVGDKWYCNYSNRLASLKNHISKQLGFLIQDIRSAEYHNTRSLRRHPHYTCTECHALVPDFNTSTTKTEELTCHECNNIIKIAEVDKKANPIVWKARGANNIVSLQDPVSSEEDSRATYEDTIVGYDVALADESTFLSTNEDQRSEAFEQLIDRIRFLSASCLTKKQYDKLVADSTVIKDRNGVPETLNFQIFYNYFFTDDPEKKKELKGRAKNKSDETSTYRQLALKFLQKEQHYTQCTDCLHKMYEPTESAKFKKLGTRKVCESCTGINVLYHGPRCGQAGSTNPTCKEHGNLEVVMYIFQTIEPKVRRLEKLVKEDKKAQELAERVSDMIKVRDKLDAYTDMALLLNY